MIENEFINGLGTADKFILWSQGYVLAIMLMVVIVWRERKTKQALLELTDKATQEMAEVQKQFDNAVAALKDQYEAQIDALQNAEGVVWVKIGPAGHECPTCSQRKALAGDSH